MVTESTRNGRSSVTIWTTVAPLVHPSSDWPGVRIAMVARADGRFMASS